MIMCENGEHEPLHLKDLQYVKFYVFFSWKNKVGLEQYESEQMFG